MSPANLQSLQLYKRYACKLAFPLVHTSPVRCKLAFLLTCVSTAWNGLYCSTAITYYMYIISAAGNALLLIGVKTDCRVKKEVQ